VLLVSGKDGFDLRYELIGRARLVQPTVNV
jgi:hypothetical protein